MENVDLSPIIIGFILGIICMLPITILVKRKWNRRGRLEQFKYGKQYLYYGHGTINDIKIVCCSKGFSTKNFFFECPINLNINTLKHGMCYTYYKDESGKTSLISYVEYCNLTAKA